MALAGPLQRRIPSINSCYEYHVRPMHVARSTEKHSWPQSDPWQRSSNVTSPSPLSSQFCMGTQRTSILLGPSRDLVLWPRSQNVEESCALGHSQVQSLKISPHSPWHLQPSPVHAQHGGARQRSMGCAHGRSAASSSQVASHAADC